MRRQDCSLQMVGATGGRAGGDVSMACLQRGCTSPTEELQVQKEQVSMAANHHPVTQARRRRSQDPCIRFGILVLVLSCMVVAQHLHTEG